MGLNTLSWTDSTEDHPNGEIFAVPGSSRCPVKVLKAYLSHLNPDLESLFQRPKDMTAKFNPDACKVWYDAQKLGHNSLENMRRNMTTRAEITPYFTNHSLRAITVTVLLERNVNTRQIKAVTGHRSNTSVKSYCEQLSGSSEICQRLSQASCMVASQLKPMCLQFAFLLFLQVAHRMLLFLLVPL